MHSKRMGLGDLFFMLIICRYGESFMGFVTLVMLLEKAIDLLYPFATRYFVSSIGIVVTL